MSCRRAGLALPRLCGCFVFCAFVRTATEWLGAWPSSSPTTSLGQTHGRVGEPRRHSAPVEAIRDPQVRAPRRRRCYRLRHRSSPSPSPVTAPATASLRLKGGAAPTTPPASTAPAATAAGEHVATGSCQASQIDVSTATPDLERMVEIGPQGPAKWSRCDRSTGWPASLRAAAQEPQPLRLLQTRVQWFEEADDGLLGPDPPRKPHGGLARDKLLW